MTRREIARLLTRIENGQAESEMTMLYPQTGQAHRIGITGAPGAGKSSLVAALAAHYRTQQKTVAILAIDPTSPFSGGAILGDRIRMQALSGDDGVFIRSVATRGALGGLSGTTLDMMRALDAVGFDMVIVETVGAGQGEVEIAQAAQTTVVVEAPGMGDDIQAIKAGILEIADILVVNKADRPGADQTIRGLRAMLDLGHRAERLTTHHGRILSLDGDSTTLPNETQAWQVPLLSTIATTVQGIPELAQQLAEHRLYLSRSGVARRREQTQIEAEIADRLRTALLTRLLESVDPTLVNRLIAQVLDRTITPGFAIHSLLEKVRISDPVP